MCVLGGGGDVGVQNEVRVPISVLLAGEGEQKSNPSLIVAKEGAGRLYYRLALNYAPRSLVLKAANYGYGAYTYI